VTQDQIEQRLAIAARLKESRKMAGLSQGQVAKLLGLHRPAISEIEAGNRRVSAQELHQLCEIYEVDTNWVLGTKDEAADPDDPRLELAARELAKLKPNDLNRLLKLISAMNTSNEIGDPS
jgi:transcriptional regulator with XRE-family HTH domain